MDADFFRCGLELVSGRFVGAEESVAGLSAARRVELPFPRAILRWGQQRGAHYGGIVDSGHGFTPSVYATF